MQSTEPNLLLIDVGNTSVKVGRLSEEGVELLSRLPTYRVLKDPGLLKEEIGKFKGKVGVASVVPHVSKVIKELFPQALFVKAGRELPVKIEYQGKMGADRVANILGGSCLLKSFIVVSLGTAVVVDAIINGEFRGGLILPGLRLMAKSLKEGTALLPQVSDFQGFKPGKSTEECIRAGIIGGVIGAVRTMKEEFPGVPLILTGGDSEVVSRLVGGIVVRELTLMGVAEYLKYKGGMGSPP